MKTQIIAVSVYVVAIKKRLDLDASLVTILSPSSRKCPYIKHLRETKTDATLRK